MNGKPTCGTCPYFDAMNDDGPGYSSLGVCRVRVSTLVEHRIERIGSGSIVESAAVSYHVWPKRTSDDWCGEHPAFPAWLAQQSKPGEAPQGASADASPVVASDAATSPGPHVIAGPCGEAYIHARDWTAVCAERDRYKAALEKIKWVQTFDSAVHRGIAYDALDGRSPGEAGWRSDATLSGATPQHPPAPAQTGAGVSVGEVAPLPGTLAAEVIRLSGIIGQFVTLRHRAEEVLRSCDDAMRSTSSLSYPTGKLEAIVRDFARIRTE